MLAQRMIDVGDASLEVFQAGAGRALICSTHQYIAHQDLVRSARAGPFVRALLSIGRVVLVNPRGVGNSSPAARPDQLAMEQVVDDLEQVRLRLGGERWIFAGTTIGGMIGLLYALRYADALTGLIVSGAAPSWRFVDDESSIYHPAHPRSVELAAAAAARDEKGTSPAVRGRWRDLVIELSVHRQEYLRRFLADPAGDTVLPRLRAFQEAISNQSYDITDRLSEIATPTLVLCGRYDPQIPIGQSALLHRGIPHSLFVVFEESGHFPFAEEPESFRRVVTRFIANCVVEERAIQTDQSLG